MDQDVFICHSSGDLDTTVRSIYEFLRKNGVECFCSSIKEEGYIPPGAFWMAIVEKILKECRYIIYVVSEKSLNSGPIITELREACERCDVKFIPYITEKHIEWPICLEANKLFAGIRMLLKFSESIPTNGEPLSNQNLMKLLKAVPRKSIDSRESGIRFLRNLYEKLQNDPFLKTLDFRGVQEIESELKLRWFFAKNEGLGIRLIRYGERTRVRWGLFSKHAKRDPDFRDIAGQLKNILIDYEFFPKDKLRVSYDMLVGEIKLSQPEFLTKIYEGFVDFCRKIKPFLEKKPLLEKKPIDEFLEQLAEAVHNNWVDGKLRDGWKQGPVIDKAEKIHNCLIPYEKLDESDKESDRDIARGIPRLLTSIGYKIVKMENAG